MHVDTERIERFLHGELSKADEVGAREHLAGCDSCRVAFERAEREESRLFGLFEALDVPSPAVTRRDLTARIERAASRRSLRIARWAAGVLLFAGLAGGAYALPSTGVAAWIERMARAVAGRSERAPIPQESVPPAPTQEPAMAGIAVAPGRRLRIEFASADADTTAAVLVSLTDAAEVAVLAPVGSATFASDGTRLQITTVAASVRVELRIPRSARSVELVVNGVTRLVKSADRITIDGRSAPEAPWSIALGVRR